MYAQRQTRVRVMRGTGTKNADGRSEVVVRVMMRVRRQVSMCESRCVDVVKLNKNACRAQVVNV